MAAALLIGQFPGEGQASAADEANPAMLIEPDVPVACDLSLPSCRRWQALAKRRNETPPAPENATGASSGSAGAGSNGGNAIDKSGGGSDSSAP